LRGGRERTTLGDMTLAESLRRNAELEAAVAAGEAALAARDAVVEELRASLAQAMEQIRSLQEQLKQNSQNSSRPPSSDGPAVKRPPMSRKSGRQRGGQVGHEGHGRALVSIEEGVDLIHCVPATCGHCGEALQGEDPSPQRHQVADIPEPTHVVVEYRQHRLRCRRCGRVTVGALPPGVTKSRFGPRMHALTGLLGGKWQLSKRQMVALLDQGYRLKVSTGGVKGMERRLAAALEAPYQEALTHVQSANVVHADETSWREAKSRAWLWVAATLAVAVFRIHPRRSGEAAKALLGEGFAGFLCVDRWSAYVWVERRGLCWAHLLRDFQAMTERFGSHWHGRRLLLAGQRVLGHWKAWHSGQIDRETMLGLIEPEQKRMRRLLEGGAAATYAKNKSRGLCRALLAHQDAMWRFLVEPDLPPTNNLAERLLRRLVIWRKLSFGTDSVGGSHFVERIMTVVTSLKAQQRDAFPFLVDAFTAHAAGTSTPSLLPLSDQPT
jgi:transposase